MTTGNLTCTSITVSGAFTSGAFTASGLITANAGITVAASQAITGTAANSTISDFLSVAATTGTFTNVGGTLSSAAQPYVTSLNANVAIGATVTATNAGISVNGGSDSGKGGQLAFYRGAAQKGTIGSTSLLQGGTSNGLDIRTESTDDVTIHTNQFTLAATFSGANTTLAGSLTAGAASFTTGAFTVASANSSAVTVTGGSGTFEVGTTFHNTSGNFVIGVESTAGGQILSGATGYARVISSFADYPVVIGSNNTLVGTFSKTGLAVTGTLSATGNATISKATQATLFTDFTGTNPIKASWSTYGNVISIYDETNSKAAFNYTFASAGAQTITLGASTTAIKLPGNVAGTPTWVAGDKYLVIDASGNIHVSAVGPAS